MRLSAKEHGRVALALVLSLGLGVQAPVMALAEEAGQQEQQNQQEQQPAEAPEVTLEQAKEDLQRQMQMAQETLASLSTEAEIAEYELITVTNELEQTNARIAELDEQIPQAKQQLEEAKKSLYDMVAESYKTGTPTLLDLFMNITTFEDFLTRVEYANRLSDYQSGVVSEVEELNSQLAQTRSDLELERARQEELVRNQKERLAQVEAAAASAAAYYNDLSADLQEMIAAEEEAQREAAVQGAQGAAQEAQRLAGEEGVEQEDLSAQTTSEAEGRIQDILRRRYSRDAGSSSGGITPSPTTNVYTFVSRAFSIIGSQYQWSGYNWTGSIRSSAFTCSGVIDFARGRGSRSSSPEILYYEVGNRMVTNVDQLKYGDLVFYTYAGRYPGHVGIYIGNGSVIDSIPNGGVAIRPIDMSTFIGGGPLF